MENPNHNNKQPQKGVALVIALVVLFLLTALAAALVFATQSEMWATNNYQQLTQSRYAAETGAQMAKNWFENTYTSPTSLTSFNTGTYPVQCATGATGCISGNAIVLGGSSHNFPTSAVETSFYNAFTGQSVPGVANATYSVTAELMQMPSTSTQVWQITSTGTVAGVKTAKTQVVENIQYAAASSPTFAYGVFATGTGCSAISLSGSSLVDSYNSSAGAYTPAPSTVNRTSNGNVGTNGNVSLSGSATIHGNLSGPNATTGNCNSGSVTALTTSGSAGVTGTVSKLGTTPTYSAPSFPSPFSYSSGTSCCNSYSSSASIPLTAGTYSQIQTSGSQNVTLAAGNYTIGNINISGNSLTLTAPGTYNINQLQMSGSAQLIIAGTGLVTLNVNPATSSNPFSLSGSGIANPGVPANFEITYGGTGTIQLSGSSSSAAVVYAPQAEIQLSGSSPWFGAMVVNTISDSGGSAIHYDTALQNSFPMGSSTPTASVTGFTWNKN